VCGYRCKVECCPAEHFRFARLQAAAIRSRCFARLDHYGAEDIPLMTRLRIEMMRFRLPAENSDTPPLAKCGRTGQVLRRIDLPRPLPRLRSAVARQRALMGGRIDAQRVR
jgi:hypothetical protein